DPPDDDPLEPDARRFAEIDRWCATHLALDDLAFLRSFLPTVELELDGEMRLLCFHGSPRSFDEIILATTPDDQLEVLLDGRHAAVLAGGHTHAQMLRRFGEMLLVNPGSVGLPYEHNPATGRSRNPPWAEYAVVDAAAGSLRVELRRTPVDADAIVRAALASGMPHANWWAQDWKQGIVDR
ncbi:MAG TPA: metallophosphoesterase family protein, partial [Roseiflexaceae bacterium]|nr:metallophosphoesterase family protein [Roseiflexaceae bacterium]